MGSRRRIQNSSGSRTTSVSPTFMSVDLCLVLAYILIPWAVFLLILSCLKDGKNIEGLKAGRRALADLQDSLSETDMLGEEGRGEQKKTPAKEEGSTVPEPLLSKQTQLKGKRKEKEKQKETGPSTPLYPELGEYKEYPKKIVPSAPVYSELSDFEDMSLFSDASEEDSETEFEAEMERKPRWRRPETLARRSGCAVKKKQEAPPPYCYDSGEDRNNNIPGRYWARLAAAFIIFPARWLLF